MGSIRFPITAVAILILISLPVGLAPGLVQDLTQNQVNTTQLQQTTNVQNSSVGPNATAQTTGLVDQAGDLVSVLSNPQSGNRLIGALFTLILVGLIAWLVVVLIPG